MAPSVMSPTDMLGHWNVLYGLSAADPHQRQLISTHTMPKDVDMPSNPVLVTAPHMFVHRDNLTPIIKDGVA